MIPKRGLVNKQSTIVQSDRVPMLTAANHFVNLMLAKQICDNPVDLSDKETATYNSALDYLQRQFEIGHMDNETIQTGYLQELNY